MCPRKKWFNTYEPFEGNIILIGNDAACKIVRISSVYMKMFDGQVRTLKDVHISDLKKIFSLGDLEA